MYDLEKPLPLEEKAIDVLTVGEVSSFLWRLPC